jgi:hypothetical protein
MPPPGVVDEFGGFTIGIWQSAFGHRADKPTILYVVGCRPKDLPEIPTMLGGGTHTIDNRSGVRKGDQGFRPHVSKIEREATPPLLAEWLVETARRCRV